MFLMQHARTRQDRGQTDVGGDAGFSLIELLIVIVILGILATVVVVSVGGMTSEAQGTSCQSDRRTVVVAAQAYFAQRGTDVIPSADPLTPDGYEQTLVAEGFLHETSVWHDIDATGHIVQVVGSPCTA